MFNCSLVVSSKQFGGLHKKLSESKSFSISKLCHQSHQSFFRDIYHCCLSTFCRYR